MAKVVRQHADQSNPEPPSSEKGLKKLHEEIDPRKWRTEEIDHLPELKPEVEPVVFEVDPLKAEEAVSGLVENLKSDLRKRPEVEVWERDIEAALARGERVLRIGFGKDPFSFRENK